MYLRNYYGNSLFPKTTRSTTNKKHIFRKLKTRIRICKFLFVVTELSIHLKYLRFRYCM